MKIVGKIVGERAVLNRNGVESLPLRHSSKVGCVPTSKE